MSNRLKDEQSLYLKQHANNPVDWYPWCDEAFEKAKKEDKLIFVSIGYSACHWCHVMERESFEDEEIAKILNEHFVSIKVDKEERPDIDRHFQEIFITMNGRAGGWPLSVFITPDKTPVYSGLYIPPEARYGMVGFKELLLSLAKRYSQDRDNLIEKGREVLKFLEPKSKIQATKIDDSLEDRLIKQILTLFDKKDGGFGSAPKFPHTSTLKASIELYTLKKDDRLKDVVQTSLDMMTRGGLYDHIDGGFCRYSTDSIWLIPHFEKMTYDNALLTEVLIYAGRRFNNQTYLDIAFKTVEFMIKKMSSKGLFFSASDADSKEGEGFYFTYDYDGVIDAFSKANIKEPQKLANRMGITPSGNFEGRSMVRLDSINNIYDSDIQRGFEILKSIRDAKEYPAIDKKVITSWNAMMIKSLFVVARLDNKYLQIAKTSLDALNQKMRDGLRLYHSALIDKEPKIDGFLEDYAYYCNMLIEAYKTTLDESMLIDAMNICNEAIKRFYANGKWRISDGEFKDFAEDTDTSYPSSVAIIVEAMLSIRSLADSVYEKFIYRTLELHSYDLMRQPISRPLLAMCAIRYKKEDIIIKAKEEQLIPLVPKLDICSYPWIYPKLTLSDTIEVCSNSACFMSANSIDEVLNRWCDKE